MLKPTARMIQDNLDKLPTSLEDAFKASMDRIESQAREYSSIAKRVLAWIVCATRPLEPREVQHALADEDGETCFDEKNLFDIEEIIPTCAGLVSVDEKSNIIRLAHYTVQEYFQTTWTQFFPEAHGRLASSCIKYLCLDEFQHEPFGLVDEYEVPLDQFSFYEYSAKNWGYHAQKSYPDVNSQVQNFVQSEHALSHSHIFIRFSPICSPIWIENSGIRT